MGKKLHKKMKTSSRGGIVLSASSFAVIIVFFMISILFMPLTGEDILHKVSATYESIPRIGEVYQRSFMSFFSYTATFGSDLVFRTIDILLCFVAIYVCAAVIIGGRPRLKLRDGVVMLISFVALVCYNSSEIFTMRFSYLHNYIPIIVLTGAVLYILLRQKAYSKWILIFDTVVAVLCAASNEIVPIVFVLISIALLVANIKLGNNKENRNKLLAVLIGLCLGMIYMYGNGSVLSRAGSSYGATNDYVSYFEFFSSPIYVVKNFVIHIAYNMRHLFGLIILLTISVAIQYGKKKGEQLARSQAVCLAFSILYIIGVSQIMVLDDMESRLLSPAFLSLVIGLGMLLPRYLEDIGENSKRNLYIISAGLLVMSLTAVLDISYLRIKENIKYQPVFEAIETSSGSDYCISAQDYSVDESKLYNFKTYSPFESWTANYSTEIKIYDKEIQYAMECASNEG